MGSWYAAYTKPRTEKKVSERLAKNGWEIFCPIKEEIRQWSDRKKRVQVPFFTSYVFIKLDSYEAQRVDLLRDPALLNFVFWQGEPAIISDKEMIEVMAFFEKYYKQNIVSEKIEKGSSLKLGEGPFAGKTGVVLNVSNRKVTVVLEQLGIKLTVDLAAEN